MKLLKQFIVKSFIFYLIAGLILPVKAGSFLASSQLEDINDILLDKNKRRLREICELSVSISVFPFNPVLKKYLGLDHYSKDNLEKALQWILYSPFAQYEKMWGYLKEIALHPCGVMILHDVVSLCADINNPKEFDISYPYGIVGLAGAIAGEFDPHGSKPAKIQPSEKEIKNHLEFLALPNIAPLKPDERLAHVLIMEIVPIGGIDANQYLLRFDISVQELVEIRLKYKYLAEYLVKPENRENPVVRGVCVFIVNYSDEIDKKGDQEIFKEPSEIGKLFELSAGETHEYIDSNKLRFLFLSLIYQAITNIRKPYSNIKRFIILMRGLNKYLDNQERCEAIIKKLYKLNPNIAALKVNTISLMLMKASQKNSDLLSQSL